MTASPNERSAPATSPAEEKRVIVYAPGICHASACCSTDDHDEIERAVNAEHPTGVGPWRISKDATFANGQPNPCPCDKIPNRRHYLLEC